LGSGANKLSKEAIEVGPTPPKMPARKEKTFSKDSPFEAPPASVFLTVPATVPFSVLTPGEILEVSVTFSDDFSHGGVDSGTLLGKIRDPGLTPTPLTPFVIAVLLLIKLISLFNTPSSLDLKGQGYCVGSMTSQFAFALSLSKPVQAFDRLRASGSYITEPNQ
jgi:hypothetical protein